MRSLFVAFLLLAVLLLSPAAALADDGDASQGGGWVCPPCVHTDLDKVYEEPGTCPICGMQLVAKESLTYAAILLFDGVQIIDYTGPYEVFGQASFYVYTVSLDGKPITTSMDMHVTPHFSFENAPPADLVLIPGGHVHDILENDKALAWVRSTAAGADHVLSVCNGAFILAEAGLLDGLTATTFYGLLDEMATRYSQVKVVRDQRFVDNGKIVTSAGLTSGIDASIHIVEKIRGRSSARQLALHLEYQWDPESTYARGALADRHRVSIDLPDDVVLVLMDQDGDLDRWRWELELRSSRQTPEVARILAEQLQGGGWSSAGEDLTARRQSWSFRDADGGAWRGESSIERDDDHHHDVVVTIERSAANASR